MARAEASEDDLKLDGRPAVKSRNMLDFNSFHKRKDSATMPTVVTITVATPQNTTDFASSQLSCTIAGSAALRRCADPRSLFNVSRLDMA